MTHGLAYEYHHRLKAEYPHRPKADYTYMCQAEYPHRRKLSIAYTMYQIMIRGSVKSNMYSNIIYIRLSRYGNELTALGHIRTRLGLIRTRLCGHAPNAWREKIVNFHAHAVYSGKVYFQKSIDKNNNIIIT